MVLAALGLQVPAGQDCWAVDHRSVTAYRGFRYHGVTGVSQGFHRGITVALQRRYRDVAGS